MSNKYRVENGETGEFLFDVEDVKEEDLKIDTTEYVDVKKWQEDMKNIKSLSVEELKKGDKVKIIDKRNGFKTSAIVDDFKCLEDGTKEAILKGDIN